jgi:hypothetical protein
MRLTTNGMTLLTLTTGGLLTQGGALLQRVWGREDEQRAETRRRVTQRDDDRQARIDRACEAILEDAERIRVLVNENPLDDIDHVSVLPIVQRVLRHAVHVPERAVRERLHQAAGMIYYAGPMAERLPYQAGIIAWRAAGEIFDVVGALLRREDPDPEPEWFRRCLPVYSSIREPHKDDASAN